MHYQVILIKIDRCKKYSMSSFKFEDHVEKKTDTYNGRVKLTDLLSRLNKQKEHDRKSNIALSVAAISALAVFGIILSL